LTQDQVGKGLSQPDKKSKDKPETSVCTPACPDPKDLAQIVVGAQLPEKIRAAILALLEQTS
jgi:hypothetical protein